MSYLRSVEHKMLIKKEESTREAFHDLCTFVRNRNPNFDDMMNQFGDSYLAAVYLMKFAVVDGGATEFDPKRVRNRDPDKVATFYRYTTTDVDLDAKTFKEAISKGNYTKNECFINSIYETYKDSRLMKADKNATSSLVRPSSRPLAELRKISKTVYRSMM